MIGRAGRYLRLAGDLGRAATIGHDQPFKLTTCLTFRCNHRCGACSIWSRDKGREATADEWDRFFASARHVSWLDLTGGEIVLRRDLGDIIESVHRHLPKLALLHFPTNGLLPDAAVEAARRMVRRGGPKVVVTVSVDGPPALHDRIRGMDGAFESAMETLSRLQVIHGVDAFVGFTLQPGNLDALDATIDALAERRPGFTAHDLHVNYLHRSPHYFANLDGPALDPSAAREVLRRFRGSKGVPLDPVRLVEWAYLRLADENLRTGRSPVRCRSAELSAYVAPDGTVYPCTIDDRPIGRLDAFGWDLRALWASEQRKHLADEIANDRCPGCWTPCEANQTLLGSPLGLARALVRSA